MATSDKIQLETKFSISCQMQLNRSLETKFNISHQMQCLYRINTAQICSNILFQLVIGRILYARISDQLLSVHRGLVKL